MTSIHDYIRQAESLPGAQRREDFRIAAPAVHRAFATDATFTESLGRLPAWSGLPSEVHNTELVADVLSEDSWEPIYRWPHGATGVELYRSVRHPGLVRFSMSYEAVESVGIAHGISRWTDTGPAQELFASSESADEGALLKFADGSCLWVRFATGKSDLDVGQVQVSLGVGLVFPVPPLLSWLTRLMDGDLEGLMERTLATVDLAQREVMAAGMLARLADPGVETGVPDEQLTWADSWNEAEADSVNAWAEQLAVTLYEDLLQLNDAPDALSANDLYSAAWELRGMAERRDQLENLVVMLRQRQSAALQHVLGELDTLASSLVQQVGLRAAFETELLERASEICPTDWWTGGVLDLLDDSESGLSE
jgi:hypothetical protein